MILSHVGRTFKDNEDGQTYQVQRVVKSKADKKNPPTAYYELANINQHSNSRRMSEQDYEYQPCDEFFILKRGGEYQHRGNEYEWLPALTPTESSPGTIQNRVSARSQTTSRLLHKTATTNQAKTLCLTTHRTNELDSKCAVSDKQQ